MIKKIGRRQFLKESTGFALAIPFLPSLLTRAEAAGLSGAMPRLIVMATDHGAIHPKYMHPLFPASLSTINDYYPTVMNLTELDANRVAGTFETRQLFTGHTIRRMPLAGVKYTSNGLTGVSPVVSASSSTSFSDDLLSKMHLHVGADIMTYLGHTSGGLLGNYAASEQIQSGLANPIPTIDQVLAHSAKVYPQGSGFVKNSVSVGGKNLSWTYKSNDDYLNPSASLGVDFVPVAISPQKLWDDFFQALAAQGSGPNPDVLVVDKVNSSWQSLRSRAFGSSRRLSQEDGNRLDAYMQFLFEIERRIKSLTPPSGCSVPGRPSQSTNSIYGGDNRIGTTVITADATLQAYADVITAAMMCNLTRIGTIWVPSIGLEYAGDWHTLVHACADPNNQRKVIQGNQHNFEKVFLRIANNLNSIVEGNGKTYLDNSLVAWIQETGPRGNVHDGDAIPIVAAGGMAGFFNTGYFYDYRNYAKLDTNSNGNCYAGVPWSRFLVSMLQGMGLSPADYQTINEGRIGYGLTSQNLKGSNFFNTTDIDKPLPWSTNAA
jgi:hypothetical protein